MWVVAKIKSNETNLFLKDLKNNLTGNFKYYFPKTKKTIKKKQKFIDKSINLLDQYLFIYHEKFQDPNLIKYLKNLRGLTYFLNNYNLCQTNIKDFINLCKNNEDQDGFVKKSLVDLLPNKFYKFRNGPFESFIFQLIEKSKNKIKIKVGSFDNLLIKNNYDYDTV